MLKYKFEVELDEERLRDMFDDHEVKFTKAKIAKIKKEMNDSDELYELLEEYFEEFIEEKIYELFGE